MIYIFYVRVKKKSNIIKSLTSTSKIETIEYKNGYNFRPTEQCPLNIRPREHAFAFRSDSSTFGVPIRTRDPYINSYNWIFNFNNCSSRDCRWKRRLGSRTNVPLYFKSAVYCSFPITMPQLDHYTRRNTFYLLLL